MLSGARPLWFALLAMAAVLLMSPGSLLCLPGAGAHLPKVIEVAAILALVWTRRDLLGRKGRASSRRAKILPELGATPRALAAPGDIIAAEMR